MKITKTIQMDITKKGNKIICKDASILCLLMGTKGVYGNYHLKKYNIIKNGNTFILDINIIKKRIHELEFSRKRIDDYLDIMRQVVK